MIERHRVYMCDILVASDVVSTKTTAAPRIMNKKNPRQRKAITAVPLTNSEEDGPRRKKTRKKVGFAEDVKHVAPKAFNSVEGQAALVNYG